MMAEQQVDVQAWNDLVLNADPDRYPRGDVRRAAAIASQYMSLANSGGLNSFLTCSYELDAAEVVTSLEDIGATVAAGQLRQVLDRLGETLPASTQEERWNRLEALWTDDLDDSDVLSSDADADIVRALQIHIQEYQDTYGRDG